MNGRELVQKACNALNTANVFEHDVSVKGIQTATGTSLSAIINKFLDDVETIPEAKEHSLPPLVIEVYNSLVENALTFATTTNAAPVEINDIEYRRTRFN